MFAEEARFGEIEERLERIENLLERLVEKTEKPLTQRKFRVGDQCRIVANGGGHKFDPGDVVMVTEVDDTYRMPYHCEGYWGISWWCDESDLELVPNHCAK